MSNSHPKIKVAAVTIVVLLVLATVTVVLFGDALYRRFFEPTASNLPIGIEMADTSRGEIMTIIENLSVPWDVAALPNGDLLVTERGGTIRRIGETSFVYTIDEVRQTAEGGLLGITLDPNFIDNNYIYVYMTTSGTQTLENQVVRYKFFETDLREKQVIFGGITGANTHDGGQIAFGPDGYLYITTGDANNEAAAQDTSSLNGKILRITKDGSIPPDNPFGNAVYSYGHRNPQGIAWDGNGTMWSTEHGRSGVQSGFDELNLIEKGANYGWPIIEGDETQEGMKTPIKHSGADETWAPASLEYHDGYLYFTGLRGRRLYQADISRNETVSIKTHFPGQFGRLRATAIVGDALIFGTSNKDGRGTPAENDDRLFRVPLSLFAE